MTDDSRPVRRTPHPVRRLARPAIAVACAAAFVVPFLVTQSANAAATLRAAAATRNRFIGFAANTSLLQNDAAYRLNSAGEFDGRADWLRIENTELLPAQVAERIIHHFAIPLAAEPDAAGAPG